MHLTKLLIIPGANAIDRHILASLLASSAGLATGIIQLRGGRADSGRLSLSRDEIEPALCGEENGTE